MGLLLSFNLLEFHIYFQFFFLTIGRAFLWHYIHNTASDVLLLFLAD